MDASPPPRRPPDRPCAGCGAGRTDDDARSLAWSSHRAPDGTLDHLCPGCTRDEIRQIEAGLPVAPARRDPAA